MVVTRKLSYLTGSSQSIYNPSGRSLPSFFGTSEIVLARGFGGVTRRPASAATLTTSYYSAVPPEKRTISPYLYSGVSPCKRTPSGSPTHPAYAHMVGSSVSAFPSAPQSSKSPMPIGSPGACMLPAHRDRVNKLSGWNSFCKEHGTRVQAERHRQLESQEHCTAVRSAESSALSALQRQIQTSVKTADAIQHEKLQQIRLSYNRSSGREPVKPRAHNSHVDRRLPRQSLRDAEAEAVAGHPPSASGQRRLEVNQSFKNLMEADVNDRSRQEADAVKMAQAIRVDDERRRRQNEALLREQAKHRLKMEAMQREARAKRMKIEEMRQKAIESRWANWDEQRSQDEARQLQKQRKEAQQAWHRCREV